MPTKTYCRLIPARLIIDQEYSEFLEKKILLANDVVRESYQFIKAYFLFLAENQEPFPIIDLSFFKAVFRATSIVKEKGRTPPLANTLREFYDTRYKQPRHNSPGRKLMEMEAIQMLTAINNHIELCFYNYIKGLVFGLITKKDKRKNTKRKALIDDLFNHTYNSEGEYHSLIDEFSEDIIAAKNQIHSNPQASLPVLYRLNRKRESLGIKTLSWLPLRKSLIPSSICLCRTICEADFKLPDLWASIQTNVAKYFTAKPGYTFTSLRLNGVHCSITFTSKIKYNPKRSEEEYVEDLSRAELDSLQEYTVLAADPGKHNILQITDGIHFMRYTSLQRRKESNSGKYRKIRIKRERVQTELVEDLYELREHSSRTTSFDGFMCWVVAKNAFTNIHREFYTEYWHRKFRWNVKMNTKRSQDKFLNGFADTYTPSCTVLVIGDWEQRQGISYGKPPTLGKGIRNLCRNKGFRVLLVGEQKTSKTCCKCLEENEYNCIRRKDPRPWKCDKDSENSTIVFDYQKVWGLARCTNSQCRTIHSRDKCASLNQLAKAEAYIWNTSHSIFRPCALELESDS